MAGTSSRRVRFISLAAVSCVLLGGATYPTVVANEWLKAKPSVVLRPSKTLVVIPCPPAMRAISGGCPSNGVRLSLASMANGFRNPFYAYSAEVGQIVGEGDNVVWDLSGVMPGLYAATVEVRDKQRHRAVSSVTVKVEACRDCIHDHDCFCPPILVSCYDEVIAKTPITCNVAILCSHPLTYEWFVSDSSGEDLAGRIISRGTYVSIPTDGLAGRTVYVEVKVKGLDPSCSASASSSAKVKP